MIIRKYWWDGDQFRVTNIPEWEYYKMLMHESTFRYIQPTPAQIGTMQKAREAAKTYCDVIDELVPDSADKTVAIRKLRECGMWINVAITRDRDGSPRQ